MLVPFSFCVSKCNQIFICNTKRISRYYQDMKHDITRLKGRLRSPCELVKKKVYKLGLVVEWWKNCYRSKVRRLLSLWLDDQAPTNCCLENLVLCICLFCPVSVAVSKCKISTCIWSVTFSPSLYIKSFWGGSFSN